MSYLAVCNDEVVIAGITYYLSIAIGHQADVFWHKDNEIQVSTKKMAN